MKKILSVKYNRRRFFNKIANIIHFIWNPYKLNLPSGYCPVQCEGYLYDGEYYYFRSRWDTWRVDVCESEEAWNNNKFLFQYKEQEFCEMYEAGWISQLKAYILLNKAIRKYYKQKIAK